MPLPYLLALLGGALIGVAVAVLLLFNGRVAGISGILGGLVHPAGGEWTWRAFFVVGLLGGGVVAHAVSPASIGGATTTSLPVLALAGMLVGIGTRISGG